MLKFEFINILATVINVLLLYLLVQKFLTKPLMNIIEKRNNLIQSQFKNAQLAEDEANELKAKYEAGLKNAHKESDKIVNKAKVDAATEYNRIIEEADEKAKDILEKAHNNVELQKQQTLKEVKAELGELIAIAVEKVEGEKASSDMDRQLIQQFLSDFDSDADN